MVKIARSSFHNIDPLIAESDYILISRSFLKRRGQDHFYLSGLPVVILAYQKSKFGYFLEGRLAYFTAIWHTYGHLVHSVGNLVYFSHFGML
jgi:hypothetical protein